MFSAKKKPKTKFQKFPMGELETTLMTSLKHAILIVW
jgi:hypothetical protein